MGGPRLPFERSLPAASYYYFLSRGEERPDCQVYHWALRDKLPTLPVPLRRPDADISIDLAAVFATAYERGKFSRRVDYQASLPPHISNADKPWVEKTVGDDTAASCRFDDHLVSWPHFPFNSRMAHLLQE